MNHNDAYTNKLLREWEDAYKKGALSVWILLALKDGQKVLGDIKLFIEHHAGSHLSADDKSLYRSLRKYYDSELVDFDMIAGNGGPDRKLYRLTDMGLSVVRQFAVRNLQIFSSSEIKQLIKE